MTTTNTLYPGRPNYTGPTRGFFFLLHHTQLLEYSHDVVERVEYIQDNKPVNEVEVRLWHICLFPLEKLPPEINKAHAEREKALAEWEKAHAEREKALAEWGKACTEWEKAYTEWEKAYTEWEKAYTEWEKALDEWVKTDALSVLFELVPEHRWNGRELIFL